MTPAPEPQDEQADASPEAKRSGETVVPENPVPGPVTPTLPPAVISTGARHVKQPGAPGLAEIPTAANTHAAY